MDNLARIFQLTDEAICARKSGAKRIHAEAFDATTGGKMEIEVLPSSNGDQKDFPGRREVIIAQAVRALIPQENIFCFKTHQLQEKLEETDHFFANHQEIVDALKMLNEMVINVTITPIGNAPVARLSIHYFESYTFQDDRHIIVG